MSDPEFDAFLETNRALLLDLKIGDPRIITALLRIAFTSGRTVGYKESINVVRNINIPAGKEPQ
jgi:hypothetical protein